VTEWKTGEFYAAVMEALKDPRVLLHEPVTVPSRSAKFAMNTLREHFPFGAVVRFDNSLATVYGMSLGDCDRMVVLAGLPDVPIVADFDPHRWTLVGAPK
jgi:hypothetical protein